MSAPEAPADLRVLVDGISTAFYLPKKDTEQGQQRVWSQRSFHQLEMLRHCQLLLSPGDLVADIGASFGNHTLFFARVCQAHVLAFEAEKAAIATLRLNVSLNEVGHLVKLHSQSAPHLDQQGIESIRVIRIKASTLEFEILKHAREIIARDRPILYIEAPLSTKQISESLRSRGYQLLVRFGTTLCYAHCSDTQRILKVGVVSSQKSPAPKIAGKTSDVVSRLRDLITGDIALTDPTTRIGRKLRKLRRDPDAFFHDMRPSLLGSIGRLALSGMSLPTVSPYPLSTWPLPSSTALLVLAAPSTIDSEELLRFSAGLDSMTEFVAVAHDYHASSMGTLLQNIRTTRCRVYVFEQGTLAQTMIEYGIARAYGKQVALIRHLQDMKQPVSYTDRSKLRVDLDELTLPTSVTSRAELDADTRTWAYNSDFYRYRAIPVEHPFDRSQNGDVICYERKPAWRSYVKKTSDQCVTVSVVMTVYNSADTVAAAIQSILIQSHPNLELLIVDDCSTDDSAAIIAKLALRDKRIRLLRTPRNQGTYFAKNVGLANAVGDFITFQDADDLSCPHRLELQLTSLTTDHQISANCVRYQRLSRAGQELLVGDTNMAAPITLMFRRKQVLAKIGYFDSVRMSADDEFIERLECTMGPVRVLPNVAYHALQAEGSLTTSGLGAFKLNAEGASTIAPIRLQYRSSYRHWHARSSREKVTPFIGFPLLCRPFDVPQEITPDRVPPVHEAITASLMATPIQLAQLTSELPSIIAQVDSVHLYLTGFDELPDCPRHAKLTVYRAPITTRTFATSRIQHGYHFTLRADVAYPPDYVQKTILKIEEYQRGVVIGTTDLDADDPHHQSESIAQDTFVERLSCATLAYHTSSLLLLEAEAADCDVDAWFADQADKQSVALVLQSQFSSLR